MDADHPAQGVKFARRNTPARHHTVMWTICALTGQSCHDDSSGFITSNGRYVLREEAAKIAITAGQADPAEVGRRGNQLYSEEVW